MIFDNLTAHFLHRKCGWICCVYKFVSLLDKKVVVECCVIKKLFKCLRNFQFFFSSREIITLCFKKIIYFY